MIKVILIDDEPLARSIVREYLSAHPDYTIVTECNDGFEGVKAIHEHKPDLIFLDIQMPKINGFEMLELLEYTPSVIFTTAFDEYALKAFEISAIDYLLKPFSKERFDNALVKWKNNHRAGDHRIADVLSTPGKQPEENSRIVVRTGSQIRILPVEEIVCIEAYDDYVKIFTKNDYFLKKQTMSYFESILPEADFVRAHRSFILNIREIDRIEPYEKSGHVARMKNDRMVSLSRSGYARLREVLGM